jgi:hypothetical protein
MMHIDFIVPLGSTSRWAGNSDRSATGVVIQARSRCGLIKSGAGVLFFPSIANYQIHPEFNGQT